VIGRTCLCAAVALLLTAAGTNAAPRPVTEAEAENALHFGYTLQDEERLNELDTEVSQAEAEAAGLAAQGADPAAVAAARARADSAQVAYDLEARGRPLALEDCLGLGRGSHTDRGDSFARFRCRMTIIGDSHLVITRTEVFSASDIHQLAAVPHPKRTTSRWSERLMEDRLLTYGRLADPAITRLAQQDVRQAEEELAGLRAMGADQRSIDAAAARLRQAKQALAALLKGNRLNSVLCSGAGLATIRNGRPAYVSFRCRVSSRVDRSLCRAFMVVEAKSGSKLLVRKVEPLAPL
jgi:hypothetical protein